MPKIEYVAKRFKRRSVELIEKANVIIEEYSAQGFNLTLRQLFYQFVTRAWIPNEQREYDRLGKVVNNARLAGLIDWAAIEDRTRAIRGNSHWDSPLEIVQASVDSYALDKWADQPHRVEVWIEKDALIGVIERVCVRMDVDFFSCRGYTSQSELWRAAMRLHKYAARGQTPAILHLGDHDPSGIDMTRDIFDRLELFMGGCEVQRLALNMDQVNQYKPPPNPAKPTDSRFGGYEARYGDKSWELDALEPKVIEALIEGAILNVRDDKLWSQAIERQEHERGLIETAADSIREQLE